MGRKPDDRFSDGWIAGWLFLAVMWAIAQAARIVMDLGAVGAAEALYAWASTPIFSVSDVVLVVGGGVALAVIVWSIISIFPPMR